MTGFNRNGVITFLNVFGAGELNYFLGSNSDQLLEVMGKSGRESLNSSYINQSNTIIFQDRGLCFLQSSRVQSWILSRMADLYLKTHIIVNLSFKAIKDIGELISCLFNF